MFISPKVIARPSAINNKIDPRLSPLNNCEIIIDKDFSSFTVKITGKYDS
jgi:hypothetical protein